MPLIHPYILRTLAAAFFLFGMFIVSSFIPAMLWACVIAVSTWPLYNRLKKSIPYHFVAATVMTLLVSLGLAGTAYAFIVHAGQEAMLLFEYLQTVAAKGIPAPDFLKSLPLVGKSMHQWWSQHLQASGSGIRYIQQFVVNDSTALLGRVQTIGGVVANKGATFSFSMIILASIYYSGHNWIAQVHERGSKFFGMYWERYAGSMDVAVRAIANGLFLVAFIEAIGMGVAYYFAGLPSVILLGALTGMLSIIPLVSPVFVLGLMIYLWLIGNVVGFFIVMIAGILLLGVFDNWARPYLIGSTIKLPFLPVFFGILGGIETMGLLGLFIGPIVMVVLHKVWQDLMLDNKQHMKE